MTLQEKQQFWAEFYSSALQVIFQITLKETHKDPEFPLHIRAAEMANKMLEEMIKKFPDEEKVERLFPQW